MRVINKKRLLTKVRNLRKHNQRLQSVLLASVVIVSSFSTFLLEIRNTNFYTLTDAEKKLVSTTSIKTELIKSTEDAFTYNRREELRGLPNGDDPRLQELLLSANKAEATGKEPYQAKLSKDPTKGIFFGDAEGRREFKITPLYGLSDGRMDEGSRVVYPSSSSERHIYSFKKNGIKNDITLLEAPDADSGSNGNIRTYKYKIEAGDELEVNLLPSGDIGIYSSDPSFYGDIQIGDQKSQDLVDRARKNGEKNTLVYEIPRPFILDSNKVKNYDDVSFKLDQDAKDTTAKILSLEVRNLKNLPYPLTIDPTITVTTTSDFITKSGDTSNTDFNTNGSIIRDDIEGGAFDQTTAWNASLANYNTARGYQETVVYNGYVYVLGGCAAGACNAGSWLGDIQMAQLGSNGTLASGWTTYSGTSSFSVPRFSLSATAYNGYMYVIGGQQENATNVCGGGFYCRDVQYAPINADGSFTAGTWRWTFNNLGPTCTTYALCNGGYPTLITTPGLAAYNGYLYAIGGYNPTLNVYTDANYYAKINADGTLGSWTTATSLSAGRSGGRAAIYNGFIYYIGGDHLITGKYNSVTYAPINSDGTLGTWVTSSNTFTDARFNHAGFINNGYIYVTGGASATAELDSSFYAPINGDGSIGTWRSTRSLPATITHVQGFVYGGYVYVVYGTDTTTFNYIRSLPLGGGEKSNTITPTSALTAVNHAGHRAIIAEGYMYIVGGATASGVWDNRIFRCVINTSSGTLGACNSYSSVFTPSGRGQHASVYHNGYIYVIGGVDSTTVYNDIMRCPVSTTGVVSACFGGVPDRRQTNAFTGTRLYHGAVVYGNNIYIIGGSQNSGNTVMYSDIIKCEISSADGSATCSSTTYNLTQARTLFGAGVYNGYIYVAGGVDSAGEYIGNIEYCKINSDGSVGVCSVAYKNNNLALWAPTSVIYNGYIYTLGGRNTALSASNDVIVCKIENNDGTISSCITDTSGISTAVWSTSAAVLDGIMYVYGGFNGTLFYDFYDHMRIGPPSGVVGTQRQQSNAFTESRAYHTSVVYDGYLYIIGGLQSTTNFNDIQYCQILSTEAPSDFIGPCTRQTNAFTSPRNAHSSVINNGYIYIVGGEDGTSYYNDINYCKINTNKSVTCTQKTNAFAVARQGHASVVYNDYLYIVGGYQQNTNTDCNSTSSRYCTDIQYCKLSLVNGSPGDCTRKTSAIATGRAFFTSHMHNGYLYIIGGSTPSASNDIQFCKLNQDGTVEACFTQNNVYRGFKSEHSSVIYNSYLHIVAGYGDSKTEVQSCLIEPNGYISSCYRKNSAVTVERVSHSSVVYKGRLYVIGGKDMDVTLSCSSNSECNDIQQIPLSSTAHISRYERIIDTGSSTNTIGSFVINGSELCSYTVNFETAGSTNIFGSTTVIPSVKAGRNVGVTATNSRYIRIGITMDDSSCGSTSSITDIIVYYNDTPNAPTLLSPANNQTGVSLLPEFRLGGSDENPYQKYFRYKIDVCGDATCTVGNMVRTIDQTSSQTGWRGQSFEGSTAYNAGSSIVEYAVHAYQETGLRPSTQYWWRGYTIDPEGSNTWSAASGISTFTTGSAPPADVDIRGGINIRGGTTIRP